MRIGEIVQRYREEHNMSQRDLAKKCNLSSAIISFLERGVTANGEPYLPKFETIRKIAYGMGMSAEELISESEDFNLRIGVGPEGTPLYEDFINELKSQAPDEAMILQAYRMIPQEHRIEAMSCMLRIKDKYCKE